MDSNDFQNLPKDAICNITNVDGFMDFIILNATHHASFKIFSTLFKKNAALMPLIVKYAGIDGVISPGFIETECKKYFFDATDADDNIDEFMKPPDYKKITCIKKGDINKILVAKSSFILYNILSKMTDDKILKFCWDAENQTFIWLLRKPDEMDVYNGIKPKKPRQPKKPKQPQKPQQPDKPQKPHPPKRVSRKKSTDI